MIVGMWMRKDPVVIGPAAPIAEAARLMGHNRIRRLPVVRDRGGTSTLEGMLSATDLYRACPADRNPFAPGGMESLPPELTVAQFMSRTLVTTTTDAPIEDVAALMRDRKIGALPVLNAKGVLVGIITESDIFRAFVAILGDHSKGLRVTFVTPPDEDVFVFLGKATKARKVRILSLISSRQDDSTLSVVRMSGPDAEAVIEELWKSGHQPLNVLRWD